MVANTLYIVAANSADTSEPERNLSMTMRHLGTLI